MYLNLGRESKEDYTEVGENKGGDAITGKIMWLTWKKRHAPGVLTETHGNKGQDLRKAKISFLLKKS